MEQRVVPARSYGEDGQRYAFCYRRCLCCVPDALHCSVILNLLVAVFRRLLCTIELLRRLSRCLRVQFLRLVFRIVAIRICLRGQGSGKANEGGLARAGVRLFL